MHWVEANGVSLRYEISGEGRTPLVLVHELGGALESWDEVLPALQKEFRVLRYDQRGAGLSEKNTVLTLDTVLDDLYALLDCVDFHDPVHIVGTALGSDFTIAFAAHHPQRVARLVATSPAAGLSGTLDSLRPPASVAAIARTFKHATYREVDAGHFMAVQSPELFLAQTLPFLRGTE